MTATAPVAKPKMTHREILTALTGILMGMFVSILASTVVSSSLPVIVSDLNGSQTAYTWVVTATLLATTISTPIWGKLADLGNRKLLLQISLGIFVLASAAAGFSQDTSFLITMRVVQGLAGGGVGALAQIVMADFLSPRERGKYMGLFGAVMAVGTVGGPLIGGFVTDTINWRWNFFIALPFAIAAVILIQRTLHLPAMAKRKVKIDYWGIVLLSSGVSLLLIWMSLGGSQFEWASTTSYLMIAGAVILLALFILVEAKSSEPLLSLGLFKNRTFTFAVIASLAVGVSMFGTSVFLSQYMIMARGASATMAGLMTFPLMGGLLVISTIGGAMISRTGKWKALVVTGSVLIVVGLFLLGTIHYDTNYALVAAYMFILGAGMGLVMQNMVLVVQNSVHVKELGVASSAVNFFRTLGGTAGTAGLGAILATTVPNMIADRQSDLAAALASLGDQAKELTAALGSGTLPSVAAMPEPVRVIFESIYGDAVPSLFTIAAPLSLLIVVAVCLIPNQSLKTQTASERMQELAAEDQDAAKAETPAGN
ncbi:MULTISPECIES: MFS transporter [Micrococcaceae]|uniref:MFS transporter n=1 Tax=Micrococcaceae TaxID=1268 RepID=UPI000CFD3487|nr:MULTISPECIES: MFS transporter [unclassified Arthrobacter]MCS3493454.1 EmrB/QacA subfamily drug resistance transporter [Arthrobacter sp. JUb119]PQZ86854.1 MFS transporter [Arthrobacter sp. MYb222]PRB74579.1 MFS transporter [Arthrobacter sp. MYb214]TDU24513.1 EmrB/QacA subfamily drug resistance transporter [Arthrobacter sp. JUb115]